MSHRRKERDIGRRAIDILKFAYRAGVDYPTPAALRDALQESLRVKPGIITQSKAAAWDKQAREESAIDNVPTLMPVAPQKHRRSSRAQPHERDVSMVSRMKAIFTELTNMYGICLCYAAQEDATPYQIRTAENMKTMLWLASQMASLSGVAQLALAPEKNGEHP